MRSTVAAAERARIRREQELRAQGQWFDAEVALHSREDEEAEDDALMRKSIRMSKGRDDAVDDFADSEELRKTRKKWVAQVNDAQETYAHEDELLRIQKEDRSNVRLTAFNLREEEETGHFDDSGNYVWRRKDLANEENGEGEDDPWLQALDETEKINGEGAGIAKVERGKSQQRKREIEKPERPPQAQIQTLVDLMEGQETVIDLMKRVGKSDKIALEKVVDAASSLLESLPEVYQSTRRMLDSEIADERKKRMENVFWEYKLSLNADEPIHGPYSAVMMQNWREQGYFDGSQVAFLRRCTPVASEKEEPPSKRQKSLAEELDADFDSDGEDVQVAKKEETSRNQNVDSSWLPVSEVKFTDVFS